MNLDATLTSALVPGLIAPTKVNLIGRNEVNMVAQVIDFEKKQLYSLQADLNQVVALVRAFEANNEPDGKYFIIGREPERNLPQQRAMWEQIRKSNSFEFVPESETDLIDHYIEEHQVYPVLATGTDRNTLRGGI